MSVAPDIFLWLLWDKTLDFVAGFLKKMRRKMSELKKNAAVQWHEGNWLFKCELIHAYYKNYNPR